MNRNNFFSDQDDDEDFDVEDFIEDATTEPDEEMMDVDLRLNLADHYRAITKNRFFTEDTEAAQIVNDELRAFIRERLEVLLGLRQEESKVPVQQQAAQFTDEEVAALKALATKVLGKPQLVGVPVVAPRPEVQVAAPVAVTPKVRPAQEAPQPKKTATRKKRTTTKTTKPQAKVKSDAQKEKRVLADGTSEILVEGAILEKGGRRYEVVKNKNGELYKKDLGPIVQPKKKALSVAEINASNAALGPDYSGGSGAGLGALGNVLASKLAGA